MLPRAVEHAGDAVADGRCVFARGLAASPGFDSNESNLRIVDERMEHAGGVRTAADTGHDRIRQAAEPFDALGSCFSTDDRLERTDHRGKGVGADD